MSATSTIGIKLALDGASQAEASLRRVGTGMEQLSTSAASVRQALGGLGTALAGALSVREFVQAADAVTSLNNSLRLATGSTQAAAKAYTQLFDIAQRSRVSFTELGSTYASISRAGEALGLSQQRLLGVTEAIGNAMSISGGNAAGMQAALTQLSQGLASGALRGDELNSVMEQSPRLAKALADGLGVTTGKLRELGAEGQITAEKVIAALESQAAVLRGEVSSAVLTVGQAFTQLQNASVKAIGDFDKTTGASAALAGAISGLATGVQTLGQAFQQNETAIKTTMGVVAGGAAAAGAAALARNVGTVAVAVRALGVALTANPATLALLGIGAAVGGFAAYNEAQKTTEAGIRKTIAALEDLNKAPSIYARDAEGIATWKKASEERRVQIQKLRADLASMAPSNEGLGSVGSGDTAFARATAAQNSRLAETFDEMRTRLSGFRGDFAKYQADLENIQKLQAAGVITEKQAVGMLTELANKHGEVAKAAKAATPAVDEFAAALEKVQAKDAGLSSDYDKTLAALFAGYQKGRIGAEAYASAVGKLIEQQPFVKAALDEQVQAAARANDLWDEQFAAAEKARLANEEQIKTAREYLGQLEFENSLLGQNAEQRAVATAVRELEAKGIKEGTQAYAAYIDKIKEAVRLREGKQAEVKAAEDAATAWRKAADQIEQSLTDALMRGFESGKGFAEVLRDTVANMFKTLVLRPVIQATVQGGLNAVGLGSLGGQGGGIASNLLGGAAGNYATSAIGSAVFGNSAAYGAALGTTSIGAGSQAAMLATQTGEFGLAGLSATSGAAGGAMASLGAAMPYIGAVLAIGSLLKSLDDSGTLHTGGLGSYSAAGGTAVGDAVKGQGLSFNLSNESYNASTQQASTQMAQAIVGLLDSTAATFGQEAGYWAATGFADDTSKDGAWGALAIKMGDTLLADWKDGADKWPGREFADGEAGAREYAAAVATDVRDLLIAQVPEWADQALNALGEAPSLEQLADTVTQINRAAVVMDAVGASAGDLAPWMERIAGSGPLTTEALRQIADFPNLLLQQAGTSRDALVQAFTNGLLTGDAAAAGQAVADQLVGSIEQAMIGGAAGQIFDIVNVGIVTPMLDAILAGQLASEAISQQAIDGVVAKATAAAEALGQVLNDPAFQSAMEGLRNTVSSALGAAGAAINYVPRYQPQYNAAQEAAARAAAQEAERAAEAAARAAAQAAEEAARAAAQYQQALQAAQDYISGISRSISEFLASLDAQAGGLQSYTKAAAAFSTQLVLAKGGDRDALNNITGSAGALVETIRRESNSAAEANLRVGRVRGQLAGLPAQLSPEQFIVDGLTPVITALPPPIITGIGSALALNASQIVGAVTSGFDSWDDNNDGLLTIDEFRAGMLGKASDAELTYWFDRLDKNDDGVLSQLELIAERTGSVAFDPNDPLRSVWEAIRNTADIALLFQQDSAIKLDEIRANTLGTFSYLKGSVEGWHSLLIRGATTEFAKGGVFTNSVVTGPTPFDMGLMGEAGPEAIMPLTRGADGKLGVVAQVQMPNWSQYGRGSDNNAALVAEIRALREEQQAQARAFAQMQQRQVKVLERWDGNGLPEERVVA